MSFWSNLLGYQLVWFITVMGAGRGEYWPALLASAFFVAWQIAAAPHPGVEGRLLAVAVMSGMVVDGGLALSGWATYAAPAPALPPHAAPLWILTLWAAFSMTLNRSLGYLRSRPLAAAAFGAIGAPLAYLGAAHGWQAIIFNDAEWRGLAWLAAGWALALPLLAILAQRWTFAAQRARGDHLPTGEAL